MPGIGQISPTLESIWDYPATPLVESTSARLQVIYNGFLIADSDRCLRVVRHGHAPQYYFPAEDVRVEYLFRSGYQTDDPKLGAATYYTLSVGDHSEPNATWCFHSPCPGFEPLADRIAFHSGKIDAAFVDGEPVHAPPRDEDGGWVTRSIIGLSEGYPKGWRLEQP